MSTKIKWSKGRLIHADGDVYEDEWRDSRNHGKGM